MELFGLERCHLRRWVYVRDDRDGGRGECDVTRVPVRRVLPNPKKGACPVVYPNKGLEDDGSGA
jgi:hypothetical protein